MSSTTFLNPVFNSLQQMDYNKSSILLQDGNEVDNSWELRILTNCVGELTVRVNGLLTVGSVMHSIAEQTESYQMNWSDHALWWNQKNIWLLQTRRTLDQYNIQSDALLEFRPVHGKIKIVLPSLKTIDLRVNYSARVFQVVVKICKHLNIRYPEELSLMHPIRKNDLRMNVKQPVIGHGRIINRNHDTDRNNTNDISRKMSYQNPLSPQFMGSGFNTLKSNNLSLGDLSMVKGNSERFLTNQMSMNSLNLEQIETNQYSLSTFRMKPTLAFYEGWIHRAKNVVQKARMNHGWLDSSRSLMEHGIKPSNNDSNVPLLYLRFKYNMFYDFNLKYDTVRIHQIYEQARWDILSGNIDCTEDEMILFAAAQLQAEHATTNNYNDFSDIYLSTMAKSPYANSINGNFDTIDTRRYPNSSSNSGTNFNNIKDFEEEIDYLLNEIEDSCGLGINEIGVGFSSSDSPIHMNNNNDSSMNFYNNQAPVLEDNLRICRDKISILMRRYKTIYIVVKDAKITGFKRKTDKFKLFSYNLRDCSISQEVDCSSRKYVINLNLLSNNNEYDLDNGNRIQREQISIKFDNDEEFAKWIAAFKLGATGRTIASVDAYQKEKRNILELLKLQMNKVNLEAYDKELTSMLNDLSYYCVDRIIAKAKSIDFLKQRILEAHIMLQDLSADGAKLKYISSWQRLPNFGKSYFIVRFDKNNTIEPVRGTNHLFNNSSEGVLIAISHGRFEVLSSATGEVLRSWNFSEFKSWTVNWQSNRITLHFNNGRTEFYPLIGSCKTVIEFIGGFVFLSQRTPEGNQELNERFFHKLTGVTDLEQITLGEK